MLKASRILPKNKEVIKPEIPAILNIIDILPTETPKLSLKGNIYKLKVT